LVLGLAALEAVAWQRSGSPARPRRQGTPAAPDGQPARLSGTTGVRLLSARSALRRSIRVTLL